MTAHTHPSSGSSGRDHADSQDRLDGQPAGALAAVQSALAAEHAAVYGYGVVGARLAGSKQQQQARAAYEAHRARRDELERRVRDLGSQPRAAEPAYALPFSVASAAAAVRLAGELEDRVAAVYADAVRGLRGELRADAARALREAAVRAVGWRGASQAFPGLPERAKQSATAPPTTAPPKTS